mmetsp:Transcript_33683/g.132596  ORF Transcript_33683/g.132596 Transcript_33683/m.132596 type:complete len:110 (-) Transcript_33683:194-523(-)|eukprot:CAMPEP_0113955834 /NCGR_PEP_ID=MMETSP0011_2-20120614/1648_1 /TAXON_ID=101924 /ORGANISM="Rhodosorus marinus" /LENGTH=109 /DNA_ID=CAMNT_0000965757 /DNA_START=136 /DNA_END=465 /DNA_ORIENTATION=+ /assembly_acc=CAM_ASM_000156
MSAESSGPRSNDPETKRLNRRRRRLILKNKREGITVESPEFRAELEPLEVSERILKIRESASTARQKAKDKMKRLERENQELEVRASNLRLENFELEQEILYLQRGTSH